MAESTTLAAHLAALAEADPGSPAISCAGASVTRRQLEQRTNRLARAYRQLGVTPDSFVTIGLPNTIEFLEAAIAAWKCGATPQPVSSRLPARERRAIIELAAPGLVVGVAPEEAAGHAAIPAGYAPEPGLSDAPLGEVAAASWKAPTSGGSTGRPKLIVSTQPAVVGSVEPFARLMGMTDGDTVLITGPLYHNAPFLLSACTLVLGGHVVLMPRFDAGSALRLVQEHAVDWMYAVPTMMGRIWRLPEEQRLGYDVLSLRVVMHMAAPCPPWLKRAWIDWLGPERVWELYAATEVQAVTILTGSEWLSHPGSVGRPVVGEMQVRDPAGAPLPPGEVGEIWMRRGPGEPPPYRYIGADARTTGDGWESVGDLGSIDVDGYVHLADRMSDMLIVGGANVYPAEVEGALMEHPAVRTAVVVALPHDDLGHVPHALLELEGEVSDEELHAHLAERLAPYKIPRSFERVSEPLRDDAGKVRRAALAAARGKPPADRFPEAG
ncbi:AMP-binding protein [Geodermatophilus marinus]|uniref:AMP-binding protein n=1 Tax=Geodermatophilus sp. LHW52908 TaxID=2303986 RepID=UPI000E3D855E|nr:AMP-binding protein [Geodermatophilus sp. LHW52908]RFU19192.1 acid--CoA ligase [Geodermatophilus sp. LHW52908]